MSAFTGTLTITELSPSQKLWRLEQDLVYEVGSKGSGRTIIVPRGFITDGASVPRALWALYPSWGSYSRAAVVHDYLCYRIFINDPHPEGSTRKIVDEVFYEAMQVCGTGIISRCVLWVGVRVGAIFRTVLGRNNIVSRVNPPSL